METRDISHIVGCSDVSISSDGRVWRGTVEKFPSIGKVGYKVFTFSINNKSNTFYLHRLMLIAFVGNPQEGQEVLHKNGNRLDNRLENLRWGTRSENMQDALKHGTATIGTKNKKAKLNTFALGWIRDMQLMGFDAKEISVHFGVCKQTIQRLFSGLSYTKEYK